VFNPGDISKTIAIDVIDDSLPEADETVVLTLARRPQASLWPAPSTYTLTIQDNDGGLLPDGVVRRRQFVGARERDRAAVAGGGGGAGFGTDDHRHHHRELRRHRRQPPLAAAETTRWHQGC